MTISFRQLRRLALGFSFVLLAIIVLSVSDDVSTQTNSKEPRAIRRAVFPCPRPSAPKCRR
jgi:hypothetical protein